MSCKKKVVFVATLPPNYVVLVPRVVVHLLLVVALVVLDDRLCLVVPSAEAFTVGVERDVVAASHEDLIAAELFEPVFVAIAFNDFASGFGECEFLGLGCSGGGGGGGGNANGSGGHFIFAEFGGRG